MRSLSLARGSRGGQEDRGLAAGGCYKIYNSILTILVNTVYGSRRSEI